MAQHVTASSAAPIWETLMPADETGDRRVLPFSKVIACHISTGKVQATGDKESMLLEIFCLMGFFLGPSAASISSWV
jgi:hypothetical protein